MRPTSVTTIIIGAVLTLGFALTALIAIPLTGGHHLEPTEVALAYGDLEARGQAVYHREGCAYCHSQQIRSVPADRTFGTWTSQPGDYAYDTPHVMGRRRIGPDLRFVGDREPSADWYVEFLSNPQQVNPHSIMPSYGHLPDDELRALAAYLASRQGGWVADDLMVAEVPEVAFPEVPEPYADWSSPFERTADIIQAGGQRYNTFCASCHGMEGDGKGAAAMGMNPPPADFTDPKYIDADDRYLAWRIAAGVPDTMMPAWESALSQEEIWELVHYIREFHPN